MLVNPSSQSYASAMDISQSNTSVVPTVSIDSPIELKKISGQTTVSINALLNEYHSLMTCIGRGEYGEVWASDNASILVALDENDSIPLNQVVLKKCLMSSGEASKFDRETTMQRQAEPIAPHLYLAKDKKMVMERLEGMSVGRAMMHLNYQASGKKSQKYFDLGYKFSKAQKILKPWSKQFDTLNTKLFALGVNHGDWHFGNHYLQLTNLPQGYRTLPANEKLSLFMSALKAGPGRSGDRGVAIEARVIDFGEAKPTKTPKSKVGSAIWRFLMTQERLFDTQSEKFMPEEYTDSKINT